VSSGSAPRCSTNEPARSKRHEENIESEDRLNYIFENAEKSFFLIVDLGLNLLFLYLVRTRLIAQGLTKYWRLFNYNAWMVAICTTTDITLLGLLSHHNHYLYALPSTVHQSPPPYQHPPLITATRYVQFAPLGYIIKLYIELTMATLISKVVQSSKNPCRSSLSLPSSNNHNHNPHHKRTSTTAPQNQPPRKSGHMNLNRSPSTHNRTASPHVAISGGAGRPHHFSHSHPHVEPHPGSFLHLSIGSRKSDLESRGGSSGSEIPLAGLGLGEGEGERRGEGRGMGMGMGMIVKTVQTTVVVGERGEERGMGEGGGEKGVCRGEGGEWMGGLKVGREG